MCFITAAELFPCPVERLGPSSTLQRGGETLAQHFLLPSPISAPSCAHTGTTALQPSPASSLWLYKWGKKVHRRNKPQFFAAAGQLCGSGRSAACQPLMLFLGQPCSGEPAWMAREWLCCSVFFGRKISPKSELTAWPHLSEQ